MGQIADRYKSKTISLEESNKVIGKVGGRTSIIDVTFSGDGAAYVAGDVLGTTQTISNAMSENGGTGVLQSLTLLSEDNLALAMDIVLFQVTQSLGTDNAAVTITDANARDRLGAVSIVAGDYISLVNSQLATVRNVSLGVQSASNSRDLFIGLILRAGGTYTASSLRIRLTFLQD